MAKKYFNKRINSKKRRIINITIIIVCIVAIIACLLITRNFSGESESNEIIINAQETVNLEIYSEEPDKDIFFYELVGVDDSEISIDFEDVDFDTLGTYFVYVYVGSDEYTVTLNIVDLTNPELVLNNLSIDEGDSYSYSDFVSSCSDNTGDECEISFYTKNLSQDGESIDYSSFSESGEYEIVILAVDKSGNETTKSTTLIIGEISESTESSKVCTYGNNDYESSYILSVSVSDNGCALSLDLYQNSTVREVADELVISEVEKIKTQIESISGLQTNIIVNSNVNAILNTTGNGFVGYSIYIEVTEESGDVIASYYLDEDGDRIYIENPYSLS